MATWTVTIGGFLAKESKLTAQVAIAEYKILTPQYTQISIRPDDAPYDLDLFFGTAKIEGETSAYHDRLVLQ